MRVVVEHKAQTHFEGLLRLSFLDSGRDCDAPMYPGNADVRHVVIQMYIAVYCEYAEKNTTPHRALHHSSQPRPGRARCHAEGQAECKERQRSIRLPHYDRYQSKGRFGATG